MAPRKPRLIRWLLVAAGLALLLFASRVWWLTAVGSYLVEAQAAERADVALVLAGDFSGHRILRAAELARDGLVPRILVSGPEGMYGSYESELAIRFAVHAGFPESHFVGVPNRARSTLEEATAMIPELRRMGARRINLVTSDYHTRRAGRIFRRLAPDLQFIVVAAPDQFFRSDGWWHNREGRKIVLMEWQKSVAERLGL